MQEVFLLKSRRLELPRIELERESLLSIKVKGHQFPCPTLDFEQRLRHRNERSGAHLKALTDISDPDVQCVDAEMSYCSSFVHDDAGAVNSEVPDRPVVESDVKRLEDWGAAVRKRRK